MNASNLTGWYEIRTESADGAGTRTVRNLITQQGVDLFAELGAIHCLNQAQLGVSITPASDEQTRLQAPVGPSVNANQFRVVSAGDVDDVQGEYIFPEGAFDNVDIAEVGILAYGGKLFSRAVLKNASGATEPLTVLKDQRVVITYHLEIRRSMTPNQQDLLIADTGNVLRSHTVRVTPTDVPRYKALGTRTINEFGPTPEGLNACTATLITDPAYSGVPGSAPVASREAVSAGCLSVTPYVPGSRQRKFALRVDRERGNATGGISGAEITHPLIGTVLTLTISPPIVKTSDFRLFFDLDLTW